MLIFVYMYDFFVQSSEHSYKLGVCFTSVLMAIRKY